MSRGLEALSTTSSSALPLFIVGGEACYGTDPGPSSGGRPDRQAEEVLRVGLAQLRRGAPALRSLGAEALFQGLAGWASAWTDEQYAWRQRAKGQLPEVLGMSHSMLDRCLEDLFSVWTYDAIAGLVADELPHRASIRPECRHYKSWSSAEATAVFLAGNSLGPALQSLMACLLARSPVFLKAPSRDSAFAFLLIRSLGEYMPELVEHLGVGCWPGPEALSEVLLEGVEQALTFGRVESLRALRARAPVHVRLVERGPRVSLAYVAHASVGESVIQALAEDIVLYERRGCLSPVSILYEGTVAQAQVFAQRLAREGLAGCARRWPCARDSLGEAAGRMQWLGTQSFVSEVYEGGGGAVVLDTHDQLSLPPPGRVVWVKPVEEAEQVRRYLRAASAVLQGVGLAVVPERWSDLVELFGGLGVSRITRVGQLQRPHASWPADGIPVLSSLVRWVSIEE